MQACTYWTLALTLGIGALFADENPQQTEEVAVITTEEMEGTVSAGGGFGGPGGGTGAGSQPRAVAPEGGGIEVTPQGQTIYKPGPQQPSQPSQQPSQPGGTTAPSQVPHGGGFGGTPGGTTGGTGAEYNPYGQ